MQWNIENFQNRHFKHKNIQQADNEGEKVNQMALFELCDQSLKFRFSWLSHMFRPGQFFHDFHYSTE